MLRNTTAVLNNWEGKTLLATEFHIEHRDTDFNWTYVDAIYIT